MSEIIEFPPVPRKVDANEMHAKAFRDLEGDICDCVRMSEIAAKVMPDETDEHLMFAVCQAVTMPGAASEALLCPLGRRGDRGMKRRRRSHRKRNRQRLWTHRRRLMR